MPVDEPSDDVFVLIEGLRFPSSSIQPSESQRNLTPREITKRLA